MKAIAHTDGGNRKEVACSAAVILCEDGKVIEQYRLLGPGWTNNDMEYGGVLLALDTARHSGITDLTIYSDSKLIVQQLRQVYTIKEPRLMTYYLDCIDLAQHFEQVSINHVPREKNVYPDAICNLEMDRALGLTTAKWTGRLNAARQNPPSGIAIRIVESAYPLRINTLIRNSTRSA